MKVKYLQRVKKASNPIITSLDTSEGTEIKGGPAFRSTKAMGLAYECSSCGYCLFKNIATLF
jgi:hypothetical protein